VGQDFSATYLLSAVDQSLKRLGTDYLDLFQLHSPPPSVLESGEFITPLEKLKSQGKIRFYGVSCETTADALICLQYPGISALQVRLSLLDQGVLDEVLPRARERGVAIIARECYAGGLLARPVKELSLEEVIPDVVMREKKRQELVDCERTALSDGRSLPELALQFVLGLDGISTALLGMRSSAHLDTNMGYLAAPRLSQQVIRSLREYSAGSVAAR
jgi:aryl-alcohol dehydrogenase-like predicted oxidoreductase